ncbi:MAG: exopolyphosphatase [Spirochaetaceae bacterium]|jgi:nanoRNase/pAp phosphatase (c-di-AMP/oligoRNAs hydrolase)|nr:exopolyphosphatase [Spirochaetaceae bacterium]
MRLITRSDFDGLACAVLLEELGLVNEWLFVHPKDIQDGLVRANENDIVANVPYIKDCGLWFDHHSSESERLDGKIHFQGASKPAPSCARIIYDYYGGETKLGRYAEMVHFTDKIDSGSLSEAEILHPEGWVLLGFIADPRTGLGRFHDFKVSNFDLMKEIASALRTSSIDETLALPNVRERVSVYREQHELYIKMIKEAGKIEGNAVLVDLRGRETIFAGNRFLPYILFPEQNISVWVVDGKGKLNTVITVGYSIINKSAAVDIGSLLLHYGGGGHKQVGSCQVPVSDADRIIKEIITAVR